MTDNELLSLPNWRELTDIDLKLAITFAKMRAHQTYQQLAASGRENGTKLAPFSIQLYTRYCLFNSPEGRRCKEEWTALHPAEWPRDPRVYWFAAVYDLKFRAHEGLPPLTNNILVLRTRINTAHQQLLRIKSRSSGLCGLQTEEKLLDASVNFAILAVCQYNARMDHFISGGSEP